MSVRPFGLQPEVFAKCREAALTAIQKYGTETGKDLQWILEGHLNNDHVAVQAAVEMAKLMGADTCE